MNDLVQHYESYISSSLFQGPLALLGLNVSDTSIGCIIVHGPSYGPVLDHFDRLYVLLFVMTPYSGCILYLWSYM